MMFVISQRMKETMADSSASKQNLICKDSARSIEKRKEGNKLYGSKDHDADVHLQILSLYTESAALAENGSEELALAFSNRSALLLHLSKLEECLIDVDRAQRITKSKELKAKLATRKAKCLSLLQGSRAKKSANEEPNLLPEMRPSKVIPCVSELVSLKFNEKYGRYMVANQDIEPGTIVAMERGFLFPNIHKIYINCSHCLNLAWNGIPCDSCACLIYCSERCKEEAWSQYHDIECSVLPYLRHLHETCANKDCMITIIAAIRIFMRFIKQEGLENIIKQANDNDGTFFVNDVSQCSKFKSIYNLTTRRDFIDENKFAMSIFVDIIIDKTKIFNKLIGDKNYLKKQILKILWKLTWIVSNNSFTFDHVHDNGDSYADIDRYSKFNIGINFSPFGSLINHSCVSNVERTFIDGAMILYTSDYIKKGQQLFISYGTSLDEKADDRKKYLSDGYSFICDCDPCRENWSSDLHEKQKNIETILKLTTEFLSMGVEKTFASIIKDDEFPMNEKHLNDIKKMIKKVNQHYTGFDAIVNKQCFRNYIVKYFNSTYGMKLNVPNKC